MINRFSPGTISIVVILITVGAGLAVFAAHHQQGQLPPQVQDLMWPGPRRLQAFTTIDHRGTEFGLQNLHGSWSFLRK